jgi:hypothetical protein
MRGLTLDLDQFARVALERLAERSNGSTGLAVTTASLYYLADRDSDRPAWRVPRFAQTPKAAETLQVEIDDETWRALSEEAKRQSVTAELLAMHALLYYVADMDSGRMGTRLEEAVQPPPRSNR